MVKTVNHDEPLAVARESIDVLAKSSLLLQHYVNSEDDMMKTIAKRLHATLFTKNTIHITGMGRSRLVGKFFSECLLDQNLSSSLIGSTYAKPVRNGDVIFGISGSGTTRTTVNNVMATTFKEVFITALSSRKGSSLARFADAAVIFDWTSKERTQVNYVFNQLTGKRASLTPMGTMFEFTSLIFFIALTKAIQNYENAADIMSQVTSYIYNSLIQLEKELTPEKSLYNSSLIFLERVKKDRYEDKQVFWHGTNLAGIIATMAGMRAQHASLRMRALTSWRFRKKEDHLLVISDNEKELRSGESRLKEALATPKLRTTIIIPQYLTSELPFEVYNTISIPIKKPKNEFISKEAPYRRPLSTLVFQALASAYLVSMIAQLAFDLGIQENEMSDLHANIE